MLEKQTTWEERNLGVTGYEYYIDVSEEPVGVFANIDNCKAQYQVLHIACGNTAVLLEAQKRGFTFIEMNIQLQSELTDVSLPVIYQRFDRFLSFSIADTEEQTQILNEIRNSEMFTTDKIARDPCFGIKQTGRRFALWTRDVLDAGARMLLIKYKELTIGFDICLDKGDGVCEAFLGGVLPEYQNKGIGFVPIYMIMQFARNEGYKKMITGVSSNNMPILKLHELFGFKIYNLSYALIKHMQ
jgi:GNAT superfamily N-acetyltransferase